MAIWTPTNKTEKADLIKDLKRMADSIDDEKVQKETGKRLITSEEANKLARLENYDDTKLNEKIEEQETKIAELEEEVEALYGDFEPAKASGEIVTITDGVDKSRVEVQGDGNSYQDTREGYNLVKFESETSTQNGVTSKYKENTVKINGTNAGIGVIIPGTGNRKSIGKFKAGTYTYFVRILGGTVSFGVADTDFAMSIYDLAEGGSNVASINYLGINILKKTFTLTEEKELYYGCYINKASATFNNLEIGFVIHEGTETKPYENYGATPSTEFPSDIEVIDMVNRLPKTAEHIHTANGGTITSNGKGEYSIKGTFTATTYYDFPLDKEVTIQKGEYLHCLNNVLNGNVAVALIYNTTQVTFTSFSAVNKIQDISAYVGKTFNKFRLYTNANNTMDITVKPMLVKSSTYKPFVPYGCIGLLQRGKNLFDKKSIGWSGNGVVEFYHIFLGAGTYTMSSPDMPVFSQGKNLFFLAGKVTSGATSNVNGVDKDTPRTVTTTDGYVTIGNRYNYNNDVGLYHPEDYNWQIEKGTVATEFEEYKENLIPIDLAGNSLAKVGDIADLLNIGLDGSVSDKKATDRYIFTGEESSLIENYVTKGLFQITLDNVTIDLDTPRAKSNYLKGTAGKYITQTGVNNCVSTYNGNRIFIRIDEFANNLDGLKNWLKEKYTNGTPLYVDYVLAKSNTIELPSISSIKLFEGTNNFELVTNLDTTLEVSYRKSNKKRLKALESAVLSLGGISNV